jgi:inner membrane protein
MDNFTHSLAGWALGQTGLKTRSRKGLAALIMGANMPDIDVFFTWAPWVPLATHRGFTHGLIGGVLLMPPLLAGLLWLLDRWQISRGERFDGGLSMHFPWLVALAYIGTLTHPLLDLQTTYSVQLLSPFSTQWFHAESLFIIDIWLWSGLSFAIWLSRRREKRAGAWRRPAVIALAAACVYIAFNGAISLMARNALVAAVRPQPDILFANSQPALFWKRNLVWRREGMIGRASYDPLRSISSVSDVAPPEPDNMRDPVVRRAMGATPALVRFMRWSTVPVAAVERRRCSAIVLFSDARFGTPRPGSRFLEQASVPLSGRGCPGD